MARIDSLKNSKLFNLPKNIELNSDILILSYLEFKNPKNSR